MGKLQDINSRLIDFCIDFIKSKDASYLAKEGHIVYYCSLTGKKSDYTWNKLSCLQALRIIRATRISYEEGVLLNEGHLISAFQELDRVYEYGMSSRAKLSKEIFNFLERSVQDLGDIIMSSLVKELQSQNYSAVLFNDIVEIFQGLNTALDARISHADMRNLIHKHFPASGYEIRTDKNRPQIDGRKQSAIMTPDTKPKDVVQLNKEIKSIFIRKLHGVLK